MELFDFLVKMGPSGTYVITLSIVIANVLFILVHRKYYAMQRGMFDEQISTLKINYEQQLKQKDETIVMGKNMLDMCKQACTDTEKERLMYRDKLHEEKANHQATLLRAEGLESRPNLTQILESQQSFYTKMIEVFNTMDHKFNVELKASAETNLQVLNLLKEISANQKENYGSKDA